MGYLSLDVVKPAHVGCNIRYLACLEHLPTARTV